MVKLLRNSVSLSDLWVSSHEKSSDFTTSSWQRGDSPIPMLVLRTVLTAVSIAILVWSIVASPNPTWLVFLTNWGLLFIVMMTMSSLLISFMALFKKSYDGNQLPWYVSMYWFLFNITVTLAIIITALYWILLYNPEVEEPDSFWLSFATHAINSCIAMAEMLTSRTPIRFLHLYQPFGLGLWYGAFTGIFYAAGGTVNGNPFIYEVLDWREGLRSGAVVALSLIGIIIVYAVLWGLALCRDKISTCLIRTTGHDLVSTPADSHMFDGAV